MAKLEHTHHNTAIDAPFWCIVQQVKTLKRYISMTFVLAQYSLKHK